MIWRPTLLVFGLLATGAIANAPENAHSFGCSDIVVIGRIVTVSGDRIFDLDPSAVWQSRWQPRVRIKRLVRGSETRPVVPAF